MTFIPPDGIDTRSSYQILASPTLYSGQTVTTVLAADAHNAQPITAQLIVRVYGTDDAIETIMGPAVVLRAGTSAPLLWQIPDTHGAPIMAVGVQLTSTTRADGTVYVDYLTWSGSPTVTFTRPTHAGKLWRRAWVDASDQWDPQWPEAFRFAQNSGTGMISQGTADWTDYRATATITPHLIAHGGLAVRVQGLRRYYALELQAGGSVALIKQYDDETTVLAQQTCDWQPEQTYAFQIDMRGNQITAQVAGITLTANDASLAHGGVGLVCAEGRIACERVTIQP